MSIISIEFEEELEEEYIEPPKLILLSEVKAATKMIRPYIPKTPCLASHRMKEFVMNLYYKLEITLKSGCFKERGVLYMLMEYVKSLSLPPEAPKPGIMIATLGNAAISLCTHAKKQKVPVTVVLPTFISPTKVRKIKKLGGHVIMHGASLLHAIDHAKIVAEDKDLTFIDGRDHPQVLTGYGSLGLEILEDLPSVEAILVPVGCGGLLAAIATVVKQIKPSCLVYGVEVESMPTFTKSLESGDSVIVPMHSSIADNIKTSHVGYNAFFNARSLVDRMVLVSDETIARCILHLFEIERLVVEGSGACALAAIMGNHVPELKLKKVVCILTGGNIDPTLFPRCLQRGLAAEGRFVEFKVLTKDSTASMDRLFTLLSKSGNNVVWFEQDHTWLTEGTSKVQVTVVCECANIKNAMFLKRFMERAYPDNVFFSTYPFNITKGCNCDGFQYPI